MRPHAIIGATGRLLPTTNLDLLRSIYAAWGRGDFSSTGWAHPELEWVVVGGPTPGSWRGLTAVADSLRDFLNAWEGLRNEAEEYRELDDVRVLVLVRYSGRGKSSGLELAQICTPAANLFHVRDGRVTTFVHYWDRASAFASLGLAPAADSPD